MTTLKLCCFFSRIVVILPQSNLHTRFFHLFKNFDVMMIFSFQSYGLSLIDDDIYKFIVLTYPLHVLFSTLYFFLSFSNPFQSSSARIIGSHHCLSGDYGTDAALGPSSSFYCGATCPADLQKPPFFRILKV